jgi:hypothetical protein
MQTAAKLPELARLLGLTGPMSGKRHHFGTCAPSKDAALIFLASINLGRTRDRGCLALGEHSISCPRSPLLADSVAKVVLHWWLEILRAADVRFV